MKIIVTDADAVAASVAAVAHRGAVVVLTTHRVPLTRIVCAVLAGVSERVVIEAKDVTMDPELWVLRFGSRDDLFDDADVDALIALAGQHLGSLLIVHCGQGISRSTACAALLFAAADGLGREDALVAAREAPEKGFAWRERRGFIPNGRILDVGFARLCTTCRHTQRRRGTECSDASGACGHARVVDNELEQRPIVVAVPQCVPNDALHGARALLLKHSARGGLPQAAIVGQGPRDIAMLVPAHANRDSSGHRCGGDSLDRRSSRTFVGGTPGRRQECERHGS